MTGSDSRCKAPERDPEKRPFWASVRADGAADGDAPAPAAKARAISDEWPLLLVIDVGTLGPELVTRP